MADNPTRAQRLEALLREINPYLDAVVCYASTINEHEPNRIVKEIRELLAPDCDVCHGLGINNHHQLWPGRIECSACRGTGKEPC